MNTTPFVWLIPSFFIVAFLYASVGHGGASGYLALLSISPAAFLPDQMATTALTLNLVVAGIGLFAFSCSGHFEGRVVWPFIATSIPAAFLGGLTAVSVRLYATLLACSLLIAVWRLLMTVQCKEPLSPPGVRIAMPVGAAVGWLSGVVGVGGGIFLSPLLLVMRWADVKKTAAASACFILVNSAAGLAGRFSRGGLEYGTLWPLLAAAFAGGIIGSRLGANRFSAVLLKHLLSLVLLVASFKLFMIAVG